MPAEVSDTNDSTTADVVAAQKFGAVATSAACTPERAQKMTEEHAETEKSKILYRLES